MNRGQIEQLFEDVKAGRLDVRQAVETLRHLPYEDLGFARIDHHRPLRCGFPEVIFCPGKTAEQIASILDSLAKTGNNVIATRATPQLFQAVRSLLDLPDLRYDSQARMIVLQQKPAAKNAGFIAIVTAGTADLPVAAEAQLTCEMLGQSVKLFCDVGVAGLHRLLDHLPDLSKASVVIVIAGMEGALASVVGGLVDCPVIAVPTSVGYGASFEGLAALLAMLNSCASAVTVVNIDNGFGAAYSASLINMKIEKAKK